MTDILEEEVHASAKAISKECLSFKHDVSRKEDWETICKQVKEKKNKIDILVNNAGRLLFQMGGVFCFPSDGRCCSGG